MKMGNFYKQELSIESDLECHNWDSHFFYLTDMRFPEKRVRYNVCIEVDMFQYAKYLPLRVTFRTIRFSIGTSRGSGYKWLNWISSTDSSLVFFPELSKFRAGVSL